MAKHKFAVGNPGRRKGSKNKFTNIRQDFFDIWSQVNGKQLLADRIKQDPRALMQFAELIASLLPKNIELTGDLPLVQFVSHADPTVPTNGAPQLDAGSRR